MRTEGGEFRAFDPVALEQERGGKDLPGGILIRFTARAVITNLPPNRQFWPDVERHLAEANTQFGSYAGVVWTESIEESVTETIHAAFARDNVAYEIRANLGVGSGSDVIDNGRDVVTTILTTLEPY